MNNNNLEVFMRVGRRFCCLSVLMASIWSASSHAATDPNSLLYPALKAPLASQALLLDAATTSQRQLIVGEHGIVLYRDQSTARWQQAEVPVSTMLTAVTPVEGGIWLAVGHDGIIIRSTDNGAHWSLVHHEVKARKARAKAEIERLEQAIAARSESSSDAAEDDEPSLEDLEYALDDARFALEHNDVPPLLDVMMLDAQHGFAAGGYNTLLETRDGGVSWQYVADRLPNPEGLHNNVIAQDRQGHLWLAGERGSLYRSDDQGQTWQAEDSPYSGSWFALTALPEGGLILAGLRGHAYWRHQDSEAWQSLNLPTETTFNGATVSPEGDVVLLGQGGIFAHGELPHLTISALPERESLLAAMGHEHQMIGIGQGGVHRLVIQADSATHQEEAK